MTTYAIYQLETGKVEEYRAGDDPAEVLARWAPSDPEVYGIEEVPDNQPRTMPADRTTRTGNGEYEVSAPARDEVAIAKGNYEAAVARRAAAMAAEGDQVGALLLLKTIGE